MARKKEIRDRWDVKDTHGEKSRKQEEREKGWGSKMVVWSHVVTGTFILGRIVTFSTNLRHTSGD